MGRKTAGGWRKAAIAEIASGQHGLVTTRQLLDAGVSETTIRRWAGAGALHRVHRGVHAVGHVAPSRERDYLAAVLACGAGAALSHLAAADLLGLWENRRSPIDVTVAGHAGRTPRAAIRVHRSITLDPREVRRRAGIPVTGVERTLADLLSVLPRGAWLRAAHQALVRHGVEVALPERLTLSANERRLVAICRRHGLPSPRTNVLVAGRRRAHRVDAHWPLAGLVVEIDGYEVHASRRAFEEDREKQADLEDAGWRVLRLADAHLADAALVARRLRDRLGAKPPGGGGNPPPQRG